MPFRIILTETADGQLSALEFDEDTKDLVKLRRVLKCLGQLQANPKHPRLNSHKYGEKKGERGEDLWESYVENDTPTAWRVFWHYGPNRNEITIVAITPHP